MARKNRKRRRRDTRIPILTTAGLGIAFSRPIENAIAGNYMGALAEVGSRFTGYNFQSQQFDFKYALMNGYLPIIMGAIGSKVATKLGVNRALKKIPMIGKWVKL
jgi:hypothetical protein